DSELWNRGTSLMAELSPERSMPCNLEAERSVLGAVLVDNLAMNQALQRLKPDDFHHQGHRRIFRAMIGLSEKGGAIDLVTLKEALAQAGDLEAAGGLTSLASLADGVPRSAHVEHYAAIVKDKALLRAMIRAANQVAESCYDAREEAAQVVDAAEKSIFSIAEDQYRGGFTPVSEIAHAAVDHLQNLTGQHGVTGLGTGFAALDGYTSGLQPSDLVLVAARPSMGKTAFSLNIAHHTGVRDGKSVGIFSLEMSKEQLYLRLLASQARIDSHLLRTGRLSRRGWDEIARAVEVLNAARINIDDTPGMGILEMRAKARRLASEHGLDLLIVDYIQLMRGRGRFESRNLEISDISRSLKELAKELNIPVLGLSQLSRAPEQRGRDRRPQLSDLRESGALEQDADVVLFLFRPEVYNTEDLTLEGRAEVIIGKQRNGPVGTVHLVFVKKYATFHDPEKGQEEREPAG
ncbi:MAG: replicative DNA helicase, partial [Acidobacteriota bacterium]